MRKLDLFIVVDVDESLLDGNEISEETWERIKDSLSWLGESSVLLGEVIAPPGRHLRS